MRFGLTPQNASARLYRMAGVTAVITLVVYVIIYWFQPFSEFWNNFFSNFFLVVASAFAALVSTLIWWHYDKTDMPRLVWGPFAIGLWLWCAGELTWGILNMTVGDVPVSLPDVFWVISYFVMGFALLNQYRILFQPTSRSLWIWIWGMLLIAFTLTLAIYFMIISTVKESNTLDAVVNSFYPAGDLLLAIVALWLAHNFTGGAFARPWIGLLVFSFSDLLYAWLEISGTYSWSVDQGNLLSTIADVAYLAAYLVLSMTVLYHWLFLKYGLRSSTKP